MVKFITYDDGRKPLLQIGKHTHVEFENDWYQIFQIGRCNWYSFHFIYLYFEIDEMTKTYELTCILLGLGLSMRIDRDFEHSEAQRLADEALHEIEGRKEENDSY